MSLLVRHVVAYFPLQCVAALLGAGALSRASLASLSMLHFKMFVQTCVILKVAQSFWGAPHKQPFRVCVNFNIITECKLS